MNSTEQLARGIVILESLNLGKKDPEFFQYEEKRYSYLLDKKYPCVILVLNIPVDSLHRILFDVAELLYEAKYYAHFIHHEKLYIVFPKCITLVENASAQSFDKCRTIGSMFGIPNHQMQFERLFDADHPTLVRG